jgi:hypothetical protein
MFTCRFGNHRFVFNDENPGVVKVVVSTSCNAMHKTCSMILVPGANVDAFVQARNDITMVTSGC